MDGVPVFRPSWDEFRDFSRFINSVYAQVVDVGICKVIPPPEWHATRDPARYASVDELVIPSPILQVLHGRKGIFQTANLEQPNMTVAAYRARAEQAEQEARIDGLTPEQCDRKFWKNAQFSSPLCVLVKFALYALYSSYGADMSGSLFDEDVETWNPQDLKTMLNLVGVSMDGINRPYLYFGMWKAMFCWHTEGARLIPLGYGSIPTRVNFCSQTFPVYALFTESDMDLFSINYLHFGRPKKWYSVPAAHGARLERAAAVRFPSSASSILSCS